MGAASCFLRRVSARQIDTLIEDPSRVENVLFPSLTETAVDDDVFIKLGPESEQLDKLFEARDPSLTFLHAGGFNLGVIGKHQARGFPSGQVRKIATQLGLISDVPAALDDGFHTLKDFVTETARAGAGLILFWR
jgi:hypothetical protein